MEGQETNSGVKPYFKEEDSIWWINTLQAEQADGSPSNINLKHTRHWDFEADGGKGLYHLKLEENDFD